MKKGRKEINQEYATVCVVMLVAILFLQSGRNFQATDLFKSGINLSRNDSVNITVLDGWSKIEAENYNSSSSEAIRKNAAMLSINADKKWVQYSNIDLHTGTNTLQMKVANGSESSDIQIWVDNVIVDHLTIDNTGGWNTFQIKNFKLNIQLSGVKNVKFVFLKGQTNMDWFMFSGLKQRVVISSDFPPLDVCMSGCVADHTSDPDDVQSMVRFLLYSNEFDVQGLVASSGTFANIARKQNMLDILNLYDQVDENLRKHDTRYPPADYLRSVTYQGRSGTWGKSISNNIGAGKDSQASDSIISIVDKPDPRPVWFCFWGDCSNLAQAIWKVQNTRSAGDLQAFLNKIRIYQIAHQDSTIDWLLNNFPDLFIIYSNSTYMGIFGGSSDPLGNPTWLNANIRQNHGPLGDVYPPAAMGVDGLKEGDSPSFLYLVSAAHGMNDPENPTQPNWGGQYVRSGTTNHWVDGAGVTTISKWKSQYQAEFAQRADWMLDSINVSAPNKISSMFVGDKLKMSAQIVPGNATTTNVSWSILQPGLATIDTLGNLTATAAGKATVKAVAKDASGISGIMSIMILNRLVQSITISVEGNEDSLQIGKTLQISAQVLPQNATNLSYVWSTTPDNMATIDGNGLLSAISPGKVTVKATASDGSGITGTLDITITERTPNSVKEMRDPNVSIYPNPVKNELKINVKIEFDTLCMFNMEGKLVIEKRYHENIKSTSLQLNLTKGMYILKLSNKQSVNYSKLIVE